MKLNRIVIFVPDIPKARGILYRRSMRRLWIRSELFMRLFEPHTRNRL